jgi:predicted YcjX-like family ATPase
MDARLTKLEDFAVEARERLARVETKLDHVDKEVSQVKWWILAQIVAAFATVLGTGIAIQQMTVATFQAAGAQANPPAQAASQPIVVNVTSAPAGSTATGPTAKK